MKEHGGSLPPLLVGLYAWISAVLFGCTLLDTRYSRVLKNALDASNSSGVLSGVGDLLLLIGVVAVLAALAAIALTWGMPIMRYLLIASLIMLSFEFSAPVLVGGLLGGGQAAATGPSSRILPTGLASILAFVALQVLPPWKQTRR
jgi:hypothetical protein